MRHSRRNFIQRSSLAGLGLMAYPVLGSHSALEAMLQRVIPSSGEKIPVVGLGTWQTFDVGQDQNALKTRRQVLQEMNKLGGRVIDSSPMYGTSEATVGKVAQETGNPKAFFYATKVWTHGKQAGIDQMERSFERMQRNTMDLMQIHNLVDWQNHIKTLRAWKELGKIRYWGLTHYVDSAHGTLEKIIRQEKPDFVQFNYSISSRNAEKSFFDCCKKYGTATLINQPYNSGSLFRKVKGKVLPGWCKDYGIDSWGQFFLKFILSHEAVTCVIPGTSKPRHIIDNMGAGYSPLPNTAIREKMAMYLTSL